VAETTEAQWRREAQEAMDRIQAIYPTGVHNANWTVALHHASCLVGDGFTTWAELVDAVERYRAYQDAHQSAVNIAAHNFFDPRNQHWSQAWDIHTEADVRRDANIETLQRVFDNLPE
jgi:adenylate kinase family enzyme